MRQLVFGLDIGTTSIGSAVIRHDHGADTGELLRLGVRIFPESREPKKNFPLNQTRRAKRMMRRQLRRRRNRRREIAGVLEEMGLLPRRTDPAWESVMRTDPYELRQRALTTGLGAQELGRALYHLSGRRQFRGRDLEEEDDGRENSRKTAGAGKDNGEKEKEEDEEEKKARKAREKDLEDFRNSGEPTLGAWLAKRDPLHERRRGVHATRELVHSEYDAILDVQKRFHPCLATDGERLAEAIFFQRPVFWRKNTLGTCPFMPGKPLAAKGSWLSQQKRMLEKLNALRLVGSNQRPLQDEERRAVLEKLQCAKSITFGGIRKLLKPYFQAEGADAGKVKFNLELDGQKSIPGNGLEYDLARIFGTAWQTHPRRDGIRREVHRRLSNADYDHESAPQRVIIQRLGERRKRRRAAAESLVRDFGLTPEQGEALGALSFPQGWDPYSEAALEIFLPELEQGKTFGALLASPDCEKWREEKFPDRVRPTGEYFDRLPSPAQREEEEEQQALRNPTVKRIRNEVRKVVNNLIALYGRPDLIRIELAREVSMPQARRGDMIKGLRENEAKRKKAREELEKMGLEPRRRDIDKWLLAEECDWTCVYSGKCISMDDLLQRGLFEIEHIWPRSLSLDNSMANRTISHRDLNREKGNRLPWEAFGHDERRWHEMNQRVEKLAREKKWGRGKLRRFQATAIPDDFAARQLNDTAWGARQSVAFLKKLWPDEGPSAPVHVQPVTGKITSELRHQWGLNGLLSGGAGKNRDDHLHHAVDALVVACTHPGCVQKLARYYGQEDARDGLLPADFIPPGSPAHDRPGAGKKPPGITPPWENFRDEARAMLAKVVVSHRVRKKVSGPLHAETAYGWTDETETTGNITYRMFVYRQPLTSLKADSKGPSGIRPVIRDLRVRELAEARLREAGGKAELAFANGLELEPHRPPARKVRVLKKKQASTMVPVFRRRALPGLREGEEVIGYAELDNNHHVEIFVREDGKGDSRIVSLMEAMKRLSRREPVVSREMEGARFLMSLSKGDTLYLPKGHEGHHYWIVNSVWENGQIFLRHHRDTGAGKQWSPGAAALVNEGARKVSVDPAGRVRRAGD